MKQGTTFYYEDELNDDFITANIDTIKIDGRYKYQHKNWFYRFISFVSYRFIAAPIIWFYIRVIKRVKFVNKKKLKQAKKTGYFVYGNHTNQFMDGFCPAIMCLPKKLRYICAPANVSMKFVGKLTQMWGALPLPDTLEATKNFNRALESAIKNTDPIIIYPEAHVWPYYTKIRPFGDISFRYPVIYNKPIFTFTTTYSKSKFSKKPKQTIYVDGPFYPNLELDRKARQKELRDRAYQTMLERSKNSTYEYVTYEKKENK